jgi:hypothetical protein
MGQLKTPDIVVLVPGIMGSVLTQKGKDVWALSGSAIVRALFSLAGSVKGLALHGDDANAEDLGDGVEAPRLMPDAHLIPGFWKIDGYSGLRDFLFSRFALQDGVNYFDFPYDWRRDNRVAARKLKKRAQELLAARRQQLPGQDVKLILVTHSMGGLVSRYFLECLGGAQDTRLLITFGTPFRGSVKALDYLCSGFKKIVDISDLLRSFTSVYQLLPTYKCIAGPQGLKTIVEAGALPHLDPGRAAAAAQFHEEMRAASAAKSASPYILYNVVGTLQSTLQSAQLAGGELQAQAKYQSDDWSGDGTVPRVSATPDDPRANPRFYVAEQHGSLQNNDAVQVNLAALIEEGIIDYGKFKSGADKHQETLNQLVRLQLQIPDAILSTEALEIAATPEEPRPLQASVERIGDAAAPLLVPLTPSSDGAYRASVPGLAQGCYRVTVSSTAFGVLPVRDVCAVG